MKKRIEELKKKLEKEKGILNHELILQSKIEQAKEDQKFYEKEKASWEVMFKRYERALEERKEEEFNRVKRLKEKLKGYFVRGSTWEVVKGEIDEIFGDKMKSFDNPKDCLEYLENEAKPGERVVLDERATGTHPRRFSYFQKEEAKK